MIWLKIAKVVLIILVAIPAICIWFMIVVILAMAAGWVAICLQEWFGGEQ